MALLIQLEGRGALLPEAEEVDFPPPAAPPLFAERPITEKNRARHRNEPVSSEHRAARPTIRLAESPDPALRD